MATVDSVDGLTPTTDEASTPLIGYNVAVMNNKTCSRIQIIVLAVLILAMVSQVILFYSVSDRMSAIEQRQTVLDRHMNMLREEQLNIQPAVPQ